MNENEYKSDLDKVSNPAKLDKTSEDVGIDYVSVKGEIYDIKDSPVSPFMFEPAKLIISSQNASIPVFNPLANEVV